MEDNNSKHIVPSPMDDPWLRKGTAKDIFIFFFVLIYVFAIVFTYDYYSHFVGFVLFGLLILFGIIVYFITPKEKRRILRDISKDSTPQLLSHIRQIYVTGSLGALCIALVLGMFVEVFLAKSTSYLKATDYIELLAIIAFLTAFIYGPYLLLVKKLLPQLKERYNSEIENEKDTEHQAPVDRE